MVVIKNRVILRDATLFRRCANYAKAANERIRAESLTSITDGMPEAGGGGASAGVSAGAPDVAASDDDGDGDGDPDSDRRRPRSKSSHPSFPPALLAFEPLSHYVGFGRSRIYQLIGAGEFPPPVKVGKSSRWVKVEIDAWIGQQAAQRVGAA